MSTEPNPLSDTARDWLQARDVIARLATANPPMILWRAEEIGTDAELLYELEQTAAWLDERAAVVERIGAGGRMRERPNKEATAEAARLRGRAVVIRQTILNAKQ